MKQEHEIDDYNPYRCSHCEYVTPELSRFAYHIQRHTTQLNFICDICNKAMKTSETLKRHKLAFHASTNSVCDICGFVTTPINLVRHMKLVHEKSKKCPHCEKRYGDNSHLHGHIENAHPGTSELKYFCSICGKGFMYNYPCILHRIKVHDKKPPKKKPAQPKTESAPVDVKCQYCGVDYSSKMGITNHLRQMHPEKYYANGNTKPQLSCSQCEEKYYSRNSSLISCIL